MIIAEKYLKNFKLNEINLQITLLSIMYLYILKIIGKYLATTILKYLFKKIIRIKLNPEEINNFMKIDRSNHICYYQLLYDHLLNMFQHSKIDKTIYEELIDCLKIDKMIINYNEYNSKSDSIYDDTLSQIDRKSLIYKHIIIYIDRDLNQFNEVMTILRYIMNYLKFKNIEESLLKINIFEYRVFLEICFLFNNYKSDDNYSYRSYSSQKFKLLGNNLEFKKRKLLNDESKIKCGINDNKKIFSNTLYTDRLNFRRLSVGNDEYKLIPKRITKDSYIKTFNIIKTDNKEKNKVNEIFNFTIKKDIKVNFTKDINHFKMKTKILHKRFFSGHNFLKDTKININDDKNILKISDDKKKKIIIRNRSQLIRTPDLKTLVKINVDY